MGEFWRVRGHLGEGLRWMEAALASGGDASPARVKALVHAGWMAWERVDFERSTALSEEALRLSRELGDQRGAQELQGREFRWRRDKCESKH